MQRHLFLYILSITFLFTSCGSKKRNESTIDIPSVVVEQEQPAQDTSLSPIDSSASIDPYNGVGVENLITNGSSDEMAAGALATVYFPYNSAVLTDRTRIKLQENATFLQQNPNVQILVEGHCDERGGIQYNLALGEQRASSVRDYLSTLGVNALRMSVVSFGKERPLDYGHDETAWSKNRRTNFVITSK